MNEFLKISSAWKYPCTWKKKGVTKNREYFTAGLFHLLLLSVLYPHSCNHHRTSRCFLVCQLLGSWRDLGILGDIKKSQKPCYSFTRNIEIKKNKIYSLPPHWNLEGLLIFFFSITCWEPYLDMIISWMKLALSFSQALTPIWAHLTASIAELPAAWNFFARLRRFLFSAFHLQSWLVLGPISSGLVKTIVWNLLILIS